MLIPSNIRKQATEYDQAKRASGIITSGIIPLSLLSVTDENEEESETRTIKERLVSAVLACVTLKLSMSFHSLVPFGGNLLTGISYRKDKIEYENRLKDILSEAIKHDGIIDNMAHEFMKMPPKTRERLISSILDFEKQAQDSTVKIILKKVGSIDKCHRTNGIYRLYMQNAAKQETQICFPTRASFALYTLYLMDRKTEKFVDRLDIDKYQKELIQIMSLAYDDTNEGSSIYNKFTSRKIVNVHYTDSTKGNFRKNCYKDMRTAIKQTCEVLHESSSIFTIENQEKHLLILPKNILFDNTFLNSIQHC